jgi:hypothetical protein
MRQRARDALDALGETCELSPCSARIECGSTRIREDGQRTWIARLCREARVLENAHRRKDVGILATPIPRAAVRREARDVRSLVADAARGRLDIARQEVDQRRLARAVRADQRMELPAHECDRDAVARREAAEAPRQPTRFENGGSALVSHRRRPRTSRFAPGAPRARVRPA